MRTKICATGMLMVVATSWLTACSPPAAEQPQSHPQPAPAAEYSSLAPSAPSAPPKSKPPVPTPPSTQTSPSTPPCKIATGACASLSLRLAWLLKDGVVVHGPVRMEPGDAGAPTPVGSFKVEWKDKVHVSSEFGDDMPNSVFFAPGGIAFHAGPLDAPSHGCIHLSDADSEVFFTGLPVGAKVEIVS